jgi:hypothetical protein
VASDECRLPPGVKFSKEEQNRVVFAVGRRGDIKSLIQTAELQFAKQLVGVAVDNMMEKRGTAHEVVGVHVNFGFSPYVNYSYHRDTTETSQTCPRKWTSP